MTPPGNYHFVGVAGVGMSSLAAVMLDTGHKVSGSDRYYDSGEDIEAIRQLKKSGVEFFFQDGSGVGPDTSAVVVSTAIENDNRDLAAARSLRIPVLHRSELLARVARDRRSIAVTGTSGKSTVTGMIGWILEQLGVDPTVINGASLVDWYSPENIGNSRTGKGNLLVMEADESDRTLLNYHPDWAVITNASTDHFDADTAVALFNRFAEQVKSGFVSLLHDPGLLEGFDPNLTAGGCEFVHKGTEFTVALPGRHNAENALLAVVLCTRMGFKVGRVSGALSSFRGLRRRLELVGRKNGVCVIDEYAHNPAKIRAAWGAVAPHCERVIAVWRPHGYGPLAAMMDPLVDLFDGFLAGENMLYVLPVYDAGGTADRSVGSETLIESIRARNEEASCFAAGPDVAVRLAEASRSGDVILVMGARDPNLPALARSILDAIRFHSA